MNGNLHVRFGERGGETRRPQGRKVRPAPTLRSGNFLYVALRRLLDLEKEVIALAGELGVGRFFPSVKPEQLHGIEINEYAHQLAQATIWIGYIQWLAENGYGAPAQPILRPLNNILHVDAILAFDAQGRPVEPEWPAADVIIGNPPFLGGKKMRTELGDGYIDQLFELYKGRVPHEADLVCYWFEKARVLIEQDQIERAGLLATQAIRGGANRKVLEHIKASGDIFWAQSDRDWILDGANVHVSMVGFDGGLQKEHHLDDRPVMVINADLSAAADITRACRLKENFGLSFMGITPAGPFNIPEDLARQWMALPLNPNGRPNSDVLRPYYNGMDLTRGLRKLWIVDFGVNMGEEQAALYQAPFEYIQEHVKPARFKQRTTIRQWWLHERSRPDMRAALENLPRYIATSMVSKHHFFCWIPSAVLPANLLIVVARDDDYFFGVLHARPHELWARSTGTQLREAESGFRYTPTTTFETYPFPWPPGQERQDDPQVQAIALAARELVQFRDNWLKPAPALTPNPSPEGGGGLLPSPGGRGAGGEGGSKRTLTNLYNQRPTWLANAHRKLDAAVFAAYGWEEGLSDEQILERLLRLNLERAGDS